MVMSDELSQSGGGKPNSFVDHVLKFDDVAKADMCNVTQYALMALLPVVLLNKAMNRLVPEADDDKGSVEILLEVVAQIIVLFLGMMMIHRIVVYFPTYSETDYPAVSTISIVPAFLVIMLSLQTKLGSKVSILTERVADLWEGRPTASQNAAQKQQQQQQQQQPGYPSSYNTAALASSTPIDALPPAMMQAPAQQQQQQQQYDNAAQMPAAPEPVPASQGGGGAAAFGGW